MKYTKRFLAFVIIINIIAVTILYVGTGLPGYIHTWKTEWPIAALGTLGWISVNAMFVLFMAFFESIEESLKP